MENNIILLLTGTVNPNNMILTMQQNTEIRQSEYIDTIKFWLSIVDIRIVFVENSNCNLSTHFGPDVSHRLEILTFDGNNFDRNLGKGYGELNCIEYAYKNSKFVKGSTFIFKVTGRYKILNFSTFYNYYMDNLNVDLLIDFKWNLSFADSRFFGFKTSFFSDYLINYKNIVNDNNGVYFEHVLAKATLSAIADNYVFRPFITLPRIRGYSGTSGVDYNDKYLHWFRYKFRYSLKYISFGLGNV